MGSNLQPLAEYPEKEAELWRKFDKTLYEKRIAYSEATDDDVVTLLDYPGYYRKIGAKIPANRDKVLREVTIMKKKLLSALLCAAMTATLLAGCGGGSNDAPADNSANEPAASGDETPGDDAGPADDAPAGDDAQGGDDAQ